jgi:hypothetical protein
MWQGENYHTRNVEKETLTGVALSDFQNTRMIYCTKIRHMTKDSTLTSIRFI